MSREQWTSVTSVGRGLALSAGSMRRPTRSQRCSQRAGVRKGDVVALLLPSSIDYAVCYHASLRLGAVTSGVNPRLGDIRARYRSSGGSGLR